MSDERNPQVALREPMVYQIRITGQLDCRWSDWFEDLAITLDGGDTLIAGPGGRPGRVARVAQESP